MEYGLIGRKLAHSYSPQIHGMLGGYPYELKELEPDELPAFFQHRDFSGINVTIPYKKAAMEFCDSVSEKARRIGSVNTVIRKADGTLYGDNTDYDGFRTLVEDSGFSVRGKQCFIFGTGGASLAVREALKDLGALRVLRVSRRGHPDYDEIYQHVDAEVFVNATPVGMYPDCASSVVNLTRFQRLQAVFDLIYNPARTQLMLDALRENTPAFGGLKMLVAQAAKSSELFTGNTVLPGRVDEVTREIGFEMKNILLIGMPGCGKTTVGAVLAKKLGRELIDLDEEITKRTGMTPETIIRKKGEKAFREVETEALESVSVLSGKIISCGGGVISPKKNRFIMKRNSTVVWIQRDEHLLATDGRPLSQIIGTHELYIYREPLYIESADYTFTNNTTPEECAEKIIRGLND